MERGFSVTEAILLTTIVGLSAVGLGEVVSSIAGRFGIKPSATLRRRPPREWRVTIVDPDGVPGETYAIDIRQAARLTTLLRRAAEEQTQAGGHARLRRSRAFS